MKTILVIEDTPTMRTNIAEILQLAPYEVVLAANGKEGIERARKTRPDLILCDIRMPDLDGYGVLHILRKDPDLATVPFIFLTAMAETVDFRAGMNLGADDYLTKPFDDVTLLGAVELRLKKGLDRPTNFVADSDRLTALRQAILSENNARHSLCDQYPTTQYNRKHQLYTAGSWPTALYFISWGKVKLVKADTGGNEFITRLLGHGDLVGYQALLSEAPYTDRAELLDDSLVCTIPVADIKALLDHQPAVANQFNRMLASEVANLQERLLKGAYQSVRKRVAEALLLVERTFYSRSDAHRSEGRLPDDQPYNHSVPLSLSRENWSDLVGASTETVIRILGDLRAEGLIEINGSQITLLDINKLAGLKR
ncbi:response regulator [Spirosoma endophyticum]|uniref:cAMP-binding domain of CRP or a regulatory subunit of cAMP-dependent protein kinases n=1 Tax=Spirosoma endophyticum TaxID=662367 RepID=A0A1I2E8C9_9BACT|nr:response regulator [Spirosoma endophyticum]SFE89244.1 cAMP-binding domain of CRP or a regulatory subunit of cAMP-dependent protein kinases [Spirosoma endophyticum]